jgi:hypothetical protein
MIAFITEASAVDRRDPKIISDSEELPESLSFLFPSVDQSFSTLTAPNDDAAPDEAASSGKDSQTTQASTIIRSHSTTSTVISSVPSANKHKAVTMVIKPLIEPPKKHDHLSDAPYTPPSSVIDDPLVKELFQSIRALAMHGKYLSSQDSAEDKKIGNAITRLATTLHQKSRTFFSKSSPNIEIGFDTFTRDFLATLHSEDKIMNKIRHKHLWKPIVGNIAIILSGVGIPAVAGQLIQSKISDDHARFFFCETRRHKEVKKIEKALKHVRRIVSM